MPTGNTSTARRSETSLAAATAPPGDEIPARADDPDAARSDSDSLGIEELWVAKDDPMGLPDLASIEFDFDADDRPNG